MNEPLPCGAHLVGSVPLEGSTEVFRAACAALGRHLRRVPDGETGRRSNWIAWQLAVFERVPGLESEVVDMGYLKRAKFRLRPGASAADVSFPALGYAAAARASYEEFRRMREAGDIPSHVRFLVCLPTPFAPLHAYVFPDSQAALEPRYESRMQAELQEILAAIPAADLALQWDTAIEFAVLEGVMPSFLAQPEEGILERLVRWGEWVPPAVEVGYHLCYGDSGGKHFVEPRDTAKLVRVANHLAKALQRPLHWIHMPVPKDRSDDAYFAPLDGLRLHPETELYLGLLHSDGANARRIEAARRHAGRFGIATECGLGRRPPESVPELLALHATHAAPI
jgi:hypothetical protein